MLIRLIEARQEVALSMFYLYGWIRSGLMMSALGSTGSIEQAALGSRSSRGIAFCFWAKQLSLIVLFFSPWCFKLNWYPVTLGQPCEVQVSHPGEGRNTHSFHEDGISFGLYEPQDSCFLHYDFYHS